MIYEISSTAKNKKFVATNMKQKLRLTGADAPAIAGDMLPMHEFKIGQYVYYQHHKVEGRFIVIRLLPRPKREPRYVIRSEESPEREYTVEASELRRVPG